MAAHKQTEMAGQTNMCIFYLLFALKPMRRSIPDCARDRPHKRLDEPGRWTYSMKEEVHTVETQLAGILPRSICLSAGSW